MTSRLQVLQRWLLAFVSLRGAFMCSRHDAEAEPHYRVDTVILAHQLNRLIC